MTPGLCGCGCGQATSISKVTRRDRGDVVGQPVRFVHGHGGRVARLRHGHKANGRSSPEYRSWAHMRDRCLNPGCSDWPDYGGRGITICERWRVSFEHFLADMGPRPSLRHSLERSDNAGNYSPDNCRWATRPEQMRNTRNTRLLTHDGITMSITDWAARLGIHHASLRERLASGWSLERALTTGVLTSGRKLA